MDTYEVAQHTIANGGGTFISSLGRTELLNPDSITHADFAWVVAVDPDTSHNSAASNKVHQIDVGGYNFFDRGTVVTGMVWDFIRLYHDGSHHFGTWLDGGTLYIDHVILTSKEHAIELATEKNEKAIYNLVTKETVTL